MINTSKNIHKYMIYNEEIGFQHVNPGKNCHFDVAVLLKLSLKNAYFRREDNEERRNLVSAGLYVRSLPAVEMTE